MTVLSLMESRTSCMPHRPRWELRGMIGTYPDMALKMMGELARRLGATSQALKE